MKRTLASKAERLALVIMALGLATAALQCGGASSKDSGGVASGAGAARSSSAIATSSSGASTTSTASSSGITSTASSSGASSSGTGVACTGTVSVASLTAHNTSAYAAYNQTNFPANFGAASWIDVDGGTIPVDPTREDLSLNPITPGHVSATDVHTLIPARPDLRWFAHITPWFVDVDGGTDAGKDGGHIDIGVTSNSSEYVGQMIDDMRRRGFDGVIIDWYGANPDAAPGSAYPEDAVTRQIQAYIASLNTNDFTFIVMIDKGTPGLKPDAGSSTGVLIDQINYVRATYFGDKNYEREFADGGPDGGAPILMFFGVESAVPDGGMEIAKQDAGGDSVWVIEGSGASGAIAQPWVDQVFDWTHDYSHGPVASDPYNLGSFDAGTGVEGFYSAAASHPQKNVFGGIRAGFNGTLTGTVTWSEGKYLPRGSGACLVQTAAAINSVIGLAPNTKRMQWVTWSDWEEGTQVESGVENDARVDASVSGTTLTWTVTTGTGDESTIDHYEIYAMPLGEADASDLAADLGSVLPNAPDAGAADAGVTHTFDLTSAPCALTGAYQLYVDAVGKPCVRDHLSGYVSYPAPDAGG